MMETDEQVSESVFLIKSHQFASTEETIDSTMIDYFTPSGVTLMSPKSQGVYTQYVKDSNDNLLVDGFFRQNMPNQSLPSEINRIIAAYYLKSYSLRELREKLQPLCMEIYIMY